MDKLIIFDCDGVLVDSEIVANRIWAEALVSIGYPITTEESIRRFVGMNEKAVRQMILDETGKDIPLEYLNGLEKFVVEAFEKELDPLMGSVLEILDKHKVMRCVASNGQRNQVIRSLELTGQFKFFNDKSIFTSQQVSKGKPAPDLFLFAAKEMNYSVENCIVIEDSPIGIQAAISAGMNVIGFLGATHARHSWYEEKVAIYAIPIAHSKIDLLTILKSYLGREFVSDQVLP